MYSVVLSIGWLYEHHMVPANVWSLLTACSLQPNGCGRGEPVTTAAMDTQPTLRTARGCSPPFMGCPWEAYTQCLEVRKYSRS